jgi:DNA-binding MarR family transcriptional regulator
MVLMGNNILILFLFYMRIYEKYKFLNRTTRLPRELFTYSEKLWLKLWDIDFIFKLFNFSHFEKISPNLQIIADQSGMTKSSFQSSMKKLKEKGYLKVSQNRWKKWAFWTNTYDLSGLFNIINKMKKEEVQLSLNFYNKYTLWKWPNTLELGCPVHVPRVLDFFQKDLSVSQKENVLLKYLFWYLDENFISEVSLNIISKTTSISRSTLTSAIKWLSAKGLIIVKEQFVWYGKKIRYKNRYDLKPLLEQLNELERQKVENKLKDQGRWIDYSKQRKHSWISENTANEEENIEIPKYTKKTKKYERINFVKNEIFRLKPQIRSKHSEIAIQIREFEQELSELQNNDTIKQSLAFLVGERMRKIKSKKGTHVINQGEIIKAKEICSKLCWNWQRNRNFYIKSVRLFPNTVDRFVASSWEKSRKSKENYFWVCMSKEFQKIREKNFIK